MELVVTREALLASITLAARCADPKAAMPALVNVALTAHADGRVEVFATDLIRAFRGEFRAEVKRSGSVALHAQGLVQMVSGFPPKAEITVNVEKNLTTKLTAKKVRASLAGIGADDMPSVPEVSRESGVKLPAAALLAAIEAVRPFVSPDDTRPHLASMCFAGKLLAATNGNTLGVIPLPVPTPKVLVPREALDTWRAALRDVEGDVTFYATRTDALVGLETPAGVFSTKPIDQAYPSWEQVVPRDNPWAIEIDASEVRAATRGMPVGDKTFGVKLSLSRDGLLDELVISGENIESHRAKTASVAAKVLRGRDAVPSVWGFNLHFMLDALAPATGTAVMEGHGELDPLLFTAAGVEGYLAVVMPMRV